MVNTGRVIRAQEPALAANNHAGPASVVWSVIHLNSKNMKQSILLLMSLCLGVSGSHSLRAQNQDAETGEQLYQRICATCHGAQLQGGQAQSLVDAIWQFGSGRGDIVRNIKHGIPDFSMPSFESALTDRQINRIVDFLLAAEKESGVTKPPPPERVTTLDYEVKVDVWVEKDLNVPWAIDFLDPHRTLITERPGRLRMVVDGVMRPEPISGTPEVLNEGQGGLLDVAVDPQFSENGWVYLSYSHALQREGERRPVAMTRLVRGRIKDNTWTDEQVIYQAPEESYVSTRHHYGCRIVFDPEGYLYFAIGERGIAPHAQDLSLPNGKVHRIHRDGTIPKDNPFVGRADALDTIFTYGNRNAQGLAVHPVTGRVWETEHGPMGGDEVNLLVAGANYGWPEVTYGRDYSGSKISDVRQREDVESPVLYWSPSIAACGLDFVRGNLFPRWKNKLLAGALKYEEVRLLDIEGDRVIHQEIILKNAGRVRDVASGPDGAIYVVLNGPDLVLRMTPIRDMNEGLE